MNLKRSLLLLSLAFTVGCSSSDSGIVGTTTTTGGSGPPASAQSRQNGSLVVAQEGSLIILDRSGANQQALTRGFDDSHPSFHPNGTDLIFSRTVNNQVEICRISVDGTGLTSLTDSFNQDADDPYYSWDGSSIVFDSNGDIYSMNPDGTGIKQLTNGPDVDVRPAFSPTGSQVVFQRGQRIARVSAQGGAVTNLTDGTTIDTFPSYCPPGDIVVFTRAGELWTITNGTDVKRLTNTAHVDEFQPRHTHEHDAIYALGSAPGSSSHGHVYVMKPDGSDHRQVTTNLRAEELTVGPAPSKFTANAPYSSSFNPFSHSLGVCYGHFSGRSSTVEKDMQTLIKQDGFRMLHLYNLFTNNNLDLDPDMKATMDYAVANKIEVLLGTQNGQVSDTLSTRAGADRFVAAMKSYLDAGVVKCLALGNEPNAKQGANLAPDVCKIAAGNLRAALTAAGHPDLPITVCLAFGGLSSYPPADATFGADGAFYSMGDYLEAISAHNTRPFVFVNLLPVFTVNNVVGGNPGLSSWYPDFGTFSSTTPPFNNDGNLKPYWALLDLQYNCILNAQKRANLSNVQIYISESGWPTASTGTYGTAQYAVPFLNGLFTQWVQQSTIPVFIFEGFDEPTQTADPAWGLHDVNGNLKPGIQLPTYISQ